MNSRPATRAPSHGEEAWANASRGPKKNFGMNDPAASGRGSDEDFLLKSRSKLRGMKPPGGNENSALVIFYHCLHAPVISPSLISCPAGVRFPHEPRRIYRFKGNYLSSNPSHKDIWSSTALVGSCVTLAACGRVVDEIRCSRCEFGPGI